jgi:hypothetical protein
MPFGQELYLSQIMAHPPASRMAQTQEVVTLLGKSRRSIASAMGGRITSINFAGFCKRHVCAWEGR